jgi:hypothetical protein
MVERIAYTPAEACEALRVGPRVDLFRPQE